MPLLTGEPGLMVRRSMPDVRYPLQLSKALSRLFIHVATMVCTGLIFPLASTLVAIKEESYHVLCERAVSTWSG